MNKSRNILWFLITLLMAGMVMTSCKNDEEFVINCDIKGLGNHGLEMVYFTRGGITKQSFHPVDGKVELKASSAQPTMVEVFTLDGELLFSCVATNGDEIKVKMNLDDPRSLTLTGQDASRDFTAYVTEHDSLLRNGTDAEVNRMIAEAVRSNPASVASTLLMVTRFRTDGYELLADSLLNEIAPDARPRLLVDAYASAVGEQVSTSTRGEIRSFTLRNAKDTVVRYTPGMHSYTLLVFSDSRKPDSVTDRLADLRKTLKNRRLQMVEVSLAPDSATWATSISKDSAEWLQGWVPGGSAATQIRRLSIPRTPYYIVSDSLGHQHYRGTSLYTADTIVRSRLKAYIVNDTVAAKADSAPAVR